MRRHIEAGREYDSRVERAKKRVPKLNAEKFMEDMDLLESEADMLLNEGNTALQTVERLQEILKIVRRYKIK